MPFPSDYIERVYAGVLGKIIGVYIGRPFEGWVHERILEELGEISYYVNEKLGHPLIVADDDISGTFTFLRALEDYQYDPNLTAAQIGQTWLNYLVEGKTVLWWGGLGNSTEHTAYLRLKKGIQAPASGSIATNGPIVAQQIGGQIFIDGWALINPGDPEKAASFATRAASVSHDGEGIYGAVALAAMEAEAFVNNDINHLLDTALRFIPNNSIIYRLINDIRAWHAADADWQKTFSHIAEKYGYQHFGGGCHMVPNHALIILGLLYGGDDFQQAMKVVNTAGWDTDCNSGNLGCLEGIRLGLAGLDAGPDWRTPVADRLYIPTADGARCVSDAVLETYHIVNTARGLQNLPPIIPKKGARFHFSFPGSLQGWLAEDSNTLRLENMLLQTDTSIRCVQITALMPHARAYTETFIPAETLNKGGYGLMVSPTIYSGQTVTFGICSTAENTQPVQFQLYFEHYNQNDELERQYSSIFTLKPGEYRTFSHTVPETNGGPIARIGLECVTPAILQLDYLTWHGTPEIKFHRPTESSLLFPKPELWRKAWVTSINQWEIYAREAFRLIQNEGRGLILTGAREWQNYSVSAKITFPLAYQAGIAARVQGLRRYYALLICQDNKARLLKALDGDTILAEANFPTQLWGSYHLRLDVQQNHITGYVNGASLFDIEDTSNPLTDGGIALIVEEGHIFTDEVEVKPLV